MGAFACRFSVPSKGTLPYFDFVTDSESLIALFALRSSLLLNFGNSPFIAIYLNIQQYSIYSGRRHRYQTNILSKPYYFFILSITFLLELVSRCLFLAFL